MRLEHYSNSIFFPLLERSDSLERFNALRFPLRIDLNRWILISIEEKMAPCIANASVARCQEAATVTTSRQKYLTHEWQWKESQAMTWLDNLLSGNTGKEALDAPPDLIDWPARYKVERSRSRHFNFAAYWLIRSFVEKNKGRTCAIRPTERLILTHISAHIPVRYVLCEELMKYWESGKVMSSLWSSFSGGMMLFSSPFRYRAKPSIEIWPAWKQYIWSSQGDIIQSFSLFHLNNFIDLQV